MLVGFSCVFKDWLINSWGDFILIFVWVILWFFIWMIESKWNSFLLCYNLIIKVIILLYFKEIEYFVDYFIFSCFKEVINYKINK